MATSFLNSPVKTTVVSGAKAPARPWPKLLSAYLVLHSIWLVLYALLGKGFAYAGVGPLYVGELLLVFALIALVGSGRIPSLLRTPLGMVGTAFVLWQALCAVPYLDQYGLDTLR